MIYHQNKKEYNKNKGYIVLMSVLIVGVIGLGITLSVFLLGISASQTSFSSEQSAEARSLANSCAEDALERIRDDVNFVGSDEISLGGGICHFVVSDEGGNNRTVDATGTVNTVVQKMKLVLDVTYPNIGVISWQIVSDL